MVNMKVTVYRGDNVVPDCRTIKAVTRVEFHPYPPSLDGAGYLMVLKGNQRISIDLKTNDRFMVFPK